MANQLTQNETSSCSCAENISSPENEFSSTQNASNEVQSNLQNVPVPPAFKQPLEDMISDPTLPEISSLNLVNTRVGDFSGNIDSEIATDLESKEPAESQEKTARPILLTDTMVNMAGHEHSISGLTRFEGFPLSTLVTNTYVLESCFYSPIYWCPVPTKKTCSGMYVTYPKNKQGQDLANTLIKKMKDCGLDAKLTPPPRRHKCGNRLCCRGRKVTSRYRHVVLNKNAKIPKHMARIAAMINGTIGPNIKGESSFCLALTGIPGAIDRFDANAPNRNNDVSFNPNNLPDAKIRVKYNAGSAITDPVEKKVYWRSGCELLAHVIAESFWGVNCYANALDYYPAHKQALFEENWIRRAQGNDMMLWQKSSEGVIPKGLPLRGENAIAMQNLDTQLKGQRK